MQRGRAMDGMMWRGFAADGGGATQGAGPTLAEIGRVLDIGGG